MSEILKRIDQERLEQEAKRKGVINSGSQRLVENNLRETQRRNFATEQTQKILKEAGVIECFTEIKVKLPPDAEIRDGVGDIIWGKVRTGASLCWDIQEHPDSCSFIVALVDPISHTLAIIGKEKYEIGWWSRKNKSVIEGVIAKAFLNPGKYTYEEPEGPSQDTGGGR